MALIIKGEMPKGKCWWHDEQGKEHECQFFPCNAIYCLDSEDRKEMCLIIGEIPNKHGRLIDADKEVTGWKITKTILEECEDTKRFAYRQACIVIDALKDAPTVLEATE